VIIGQDPYSSVYHGVPVANGIAFSTDIPDLVPKSLGNIYKEIQSSFPDFKIPKHGNLMPWAKQGVLLLNRALTVYEGESANHMVLWEGFVSKVVTSIVQTESPIVFALWGSYAKKFGKAYRRESYCSYKPSSRDEQLFRVRSFQHHKILSGH